MSSSWGSCSPLYADLGDVTDGKYLRVDPDAPDGPIGEAMAPFLDELDITTSVRQFEDAITDIERDGDPVTFDGVRAYPYRVTIDIDKAIKSGALDEDTKLRPGASVDYTFFIDRKDRLRRMESQIDSARVRMDISAFGSPLDIKAPPAAEVVEENELSAG